MLVLSGLVCMAVGLSLDKQSSINVGWWLAIIGIAVGSLPLVLFLVDVMVEKLRSH
jgi:hypothetical protein